MHVSAVFPDVAEIRRLINGLDSTYVQQHEKDRDLGRALELVCANLTDMHSSPTLWPPSGTRPSLPARVRGHVDLLLRENAEESEGIFKKIGLALDEQGWPRPPSAATELLEFKRRAVRLGTAIAPPDADSLKQAVQRIAEKACTVSQRYRDEYQDLQGVISRRQKYRKVAKRSSAFLVVVLAYVGGVNDVPQAYQKLSETAKEVYEYVISQEMSRTAELVDIAESQLEWADPQPAPRDLWRIEFREHELDFSEPEAWDLEAWDSGDFEPEA